MGILGLQKWLVARFPGSITRVSKGQSDRFDHVCFDLNQVIHMALRKSPNEEKLVIRLFRNIDAALKQCIPKRSVYFAFDG